MREIGATGVRVYPIVRRQSSFLGSSRFCFEALTRPNGDLKTWLPALLQKHGITRVMAIGEADLLSLAEMKEAGTSLSIAAPSVDQLKSVLDKEALLERAKACGVPVPKSWQPKDSTFRIPDGVDVNFPLVAKWGDPLAVAERLAQHGIEPAKVAYIASSEELGSYLAQFEPAGVYPLIQEFCSGTGLGQMFHAVEGKITMRFQHLRLREWPLTGGVSSLCETVSLDQHADLRAKSEVLLKNLNWTGPAMVEYRWDAETGQARLMEINGRFWGSLPLASAAGVHFGLETYRYAFQEWSSSEEQSAYPYRIGRFMAPEVKNLRDVWKGHESIPAKLGFTAGFGARFLDPRVRYYVSKVSDLGPFFAELKNLISPR